MIAYCVISFFSIPRKDIIFSTGAKFWILTLFPDSRSQIVFILTVTTLFLVLIDLRFARILSMFWPCPAPRFVSDTTMRRRRSPIIATVADRPGKLPSGLISPRSGDLYPAQTHFPHRCRNFAVNLHLTTADSPKDSCWAVAFCIYCHLRGRLWDSVRICSRYLPNETDYTALAGKDSVPWMSCDDQQFTHRFLCLSAY